MANSSNMTKQIKFLLTILLLSGSISLLAQTQGVLGKKFFDNWSVGIGGGPNIFFGDLKQQQFLPVTSNMNEVKFGGTFTLTKQLSHVFALRGQVLYSEISGTKRLYTDGYPCNEYFEGNILEGNINATINFSNLFASKYKPTRSFFVYGLIGVGASCWITDVKQLQTDNLLRKSNAAGNYTIAAMGMAGIGMYKSFGEKINLGLEWTLHGVNSDKLDVTQREFKYDAYSMLALTVTYNFNKYNPGKEPDTNANKIYVPVYIPQPITMPVDSTPKPVVIEVPVVVDTVIVPADTMPEPDSEDLFDNQQSGSFFRVQIFAFRNDKYTVEQVKERYNLDMMVYKDLSDGWYRYTVGSFSDYADAKALKSQMLKKGFRGAFITKFVDGVRVSPNGTK